MAGFKISGKDNTEVLLAGGGSKAISSLAVGWSSITDKPINFKSYSGSLSTEGWKTMNGKANSPSIAISYNNDAANWNSGKFSASLVFGCSDTRGLLDCAYSAPIVTFGGCSFGGSTDNDPNWYMKISGTNGVTYNLNNFALSTSLNSYLPLSGGTMKSNAYIGFDNDAAAFRMQVGADTSTSPLRGITTPTVGGRWIGIFARPGKSTDEGGFLLSQEGAAIYNSFDSGFGFKVVDTDANLNDWNSADSVVFSVKNDNTVYSKGGFVKKNSSNSDVLLGGGGHKAVSDFLRRNIITSQSNMTYDANTYTNSDTLYESSGDVASGKSGITWSNFPTSSAPDGGFSLFNIQEGAYCKQLFSYYCNSHFYVRYQYYNNGKTWSNWSTVALTSDLSSYLPLTGGTLTGHLYLNRGANLVTNSIGSFANGIRINRASASNWASMTIGYVSSNISSGASGYDSHTWMIATPAGSDYLNISNNGNTGTSTGLTLKGQGNNDIVWNNNVIIHSGNISSYGLTGWRIADALGAGGAPITTSVSSTRITDSYYVLATTSSGSCAWYKLPSNAFLNDNTNTTYSPGTGLSLDGTTFNAKLATNTLLGVTKYVKYYSAASVKRYNGDVGGSEVDTSTTSNIELAYASSTSGRFYPVLIDKNGFPFVNIPWSDTTYTFTTSGSGNVLTGVSTSGTTITFTKGNVSSGSTYGVVSNSENGLAPKVISTNTASIGSAYYVLASTNGSASPSWYKLPSTAFSDSNSWRPVLVDGASISSNTLNLKHGTNISLSRSNGDVTITASSQFLVVSSLPSGSSITSGVLYLVTT